MYPIIDIETYATVDIKVGAHVYATHPETDVMCVVIDEWLWKPGDPPPATVPPCLSAWNAEFDRLIYDHILVPRYGWPRIYQWDCLMVRAYAANLPGALEQCGKALGLSTMKDTKGNLLMKQLCKPANPTKTNNDPKRKHTPENLQRLYAYCLADVAASQAIADMLPPLKHHEKRLQIIDRRMNGHGVRLDLTLARAIKATYDRWAQGALREFRAITKCDSNRANNYPAWLEAQGVRHSDGTGLLRKGGFDIGAVHSLLAQEGMDYHVRRSLELHQQLSKSSLAKLDRMIDSVGADGRLRGMYQLYGAHQTRRYAGRRVQLQNLPRGMLKAEEVQSVVAAVLRHDLDAVSARGPAPEVLASLLRACLIASPGHVLVDADYSNVEGRIVAWLAGEEWKLQAFREFDLGRGADLYKLAYSKAFGVPLDKVDKDDRTWGKIMDLAGVFGGGLVAFQNAASIYRMEMGDQEALRLRDSWRQAHPCTVKLWRSLMDGWMSALRGRIITTGRLVFRRSALFDGALEIVLPSGRPLVYHGAGSSRGEFGPEGYFMGESTTEGRARMWQKQKYYGGRATENCAQAISFDLMSDAMVRLHDAGYHTVLTTHDELALEVPESRADLALETMREIMVDAPAWAEGLPLAAGGWIGTRYRKE